MIPGEVNDLLERAAVYIDAVESTLIQILASQPSVTLAQLWTELCARMERLQEFRSLNMVHAHIQDLLARGFIRQVGPETYSIR
jgi:uncharacterized protein YceH (UPF0502 family)